MSMNHWILKIRFLGLKCLLVAKCLKIHSWITAWLNNKTEHKCSFFRPQDKTDQSLDYTILEHFLQSLIGIRLAVCYRIFFCTQICVMQASHLLSRKKNSPTSQAVIYFSFWGNLNRPSSWTSPQRKQFYTLTALLAMFIGLAFCPYRASAVTSNVKSVQVNLYNEFKN